MQRVKDISKVEFNLLMKLFELSENMPDYWYRAWVSVINGVLWYKIDLSGAGLINSNYRLSIYLFLFSAPDH